jgi:hypothetical protein
LQRFLSELHQREIRVVINSIQTMKLSASLLQAITLGVSITAVAAATVSCDKEKITKTNQEQGRHGGDSPIPTGEPCPACGMG